MNLRSGYPYSLIKKGLVSNYSKPEKIEPKRLQQFALKPDVQQLYKLVDIKDDGAVIQLPGGDKTYNVPLLKKAMELQKKSP